MSVRAQNIGLHLVRFANSLVDFTLLVVIVLMAAIGSHALWDARQTYSLADAKQYEIYKPAAEDEGKSFAELRTINPEVFSWLTVYGTNMDYPLTQGEDNWKYVSTNAQGMYSLTGNIFLDHTNSPEFTDFNSILYGHHMEKQTMFGEVGLFSEEGYFNARQYGSLYFGGKDHGLEFFAFLHVDAYDSSVFTPAVEGEARQQYLDNLLEKAIHTRSVGVTTDDHLLLLSTCSTQTTNGRDILVAKITDQVYENTLLETNADAPGLMATVDKQLRGIWGGIPVWMWLLALTALLLVALLLVVWRRKRKNRINQSLCEIQSGNPFENEPKDTAKHGHNTTGAEKME